MPKNKQAKAFLNFVNAASGPAKIELYGYIGRWSDIDEREFTQKMNSVTGRDLEVYVNSDGGSVFTALTIYNILSRHNGEITIYIDGIAASAMTIITSVPGAKVIAPVGTMMMIHDPLLDPGGPVNAQEMRAMAEVLDKVGGSIAGIYSKKSGKDEAVFAEMMKTDTYLTALEAVDLGLADEIGDQLDIAASLTRESMVVNGLELDPSRHVKMPSNWLKETQQAAESADVDPSGGLAGKTIENVKEKQPMDIDKLKAEHPELFQQVLDQGVAAGAENERSRIQAIEDMAMPGHEELVNKAKFNTGVTAEQLAVDMIKAEKERGAKFLNERQKDADTLNDVEQEEPELNIGGGDDSQDDEVKAAAKRMADRVNAKRNKQIK